MDYTDFTKPSLTEPGVKSFLNETLKQCREFRITYHNTLFNISMLCLFLLILGIVLFFKYKGKPTPVEIEQKKKQKQQYVMTKVKNFLDAKRLAHQELITGLPGWENEYDIITKKFVA